MSSFPASQITDNNPIHIMTNKIEQKEYSHWHRQHLSMKRWSPPKLPIELQYCELRRSQPNPPTLPSHRRERNYPNSKDETRTIAGKLCDENHTIIQIRNRWRARVHSTRRRWGIFIEQMTRPGSIRSTLRSLMIKGSQNLVGNPSTSDASLLFSMYLFADSKSLLIFCSDFLALISFSNALSRLFQLSPDIWFHSIPIWRDLG